MQDNEKRVISWLVVDMGFSRRNAEIALQLYTKGGVLTPNQARAIAQAFKCEPVFDNYLYMHGMAQKPWEISVSAERYSPDMNRLNYAITRLYGGEARNGRKRRT